MDYTDARAVRSSPQRIGIAVLLAATIGSAACEQDAPLHSRDAARPPDRPSALLNPLCAGTGGTTHAAQSIGGSVTWPSSGNPHRVTGTVTVSSGGTLTLQAGVIVCFEPQTGLQSYGGRLVAQGTAATPIVLTARDPALGWYGVTLQGAVPAASYLTNARVEYASLYSTAVAAFSHPLVIDSTTVRQSGAGVRLEGRASSFSRSRVDTTTNVDIPAVALGDSARFEASLILRAAGTGLEITGTAGVRVLGGRVEAAGGTGIRAANQTGVVQSAPVRVLGGGSYGIETTVALLAALYPSVAYHDSLKGNARDTVVVLGGTLNTSLYVRAGLPWHVKATILVGPGGLLRSQGTSRLVFVPGAGIVVSSGGRVLLRGVPSGPVVFTAADPARGWGGILLQGTPPYKSAVSNARIEHVAYNQTALAAGATHPVNVDSVVFRQNGRAVSLLSTGSRLIRSRVDTTLSSSGPAVELGADAILESTRIRASSREGVAIRAATVQVQSCEVVGGVTDGIVMDVATPVHNCNLVGNYGVGVSNLQTSVAADATGNWWGDAGGPTAPNGDGVSSAVTYGPWLTAPYVLPYVP